jgi:hypothetical protein
VLTLARYVAVVVVFASSDVASEIVGVLVTIRYVVSGCG